MPWSMRLEPPGEADCRHVITGRLAVWAVISLWLPTILLIRLALPSSKSIQWSRGSGYSMPMGQVASAIEHLRGETRYIGVVEIYIRRNLVQLMFTGRIDMAIVSILGTHMQKLQIISLTFFSTLLLCSTFFALLPAAVYGGGNETEFTWPFFLLFREFWFWAGGILVTITLIGMLPGALGRAWAALTAALAITCLAHGIFLIVPLPVLDGVGDVSAVSSFWVVVDAIALVGVFLIILVVSWRAPAKVRPAVIILTVMALFHTGSTILSEAKSHPENQDTSSVYSFSKEKNALVILLDSMQSDIFEELSGDVDLDGFTYFPDTAGVSPTTFLAMPTIHSGRFYDGTKSIKEVYSEWVVEGSFMVQLSQAGYSSDLVNHILKRCPQGTGYCNTSGTLLRGPDAQRRLEAGQLVDLALIRVVPAVLREYIYNNGRWLISRAIKKSDDSHFAVEGNQALRWIAARMSPSSDRPTVKFLHLFSTHLPIVINGRCEFAGETLGFSRKGYSTQVGCALGAVEDLFARMKELGVYDNTAIVLMADHGANGVASARIIGSEEEVSAKLVGLANPTLAFKPIGATGTIQTSMRPMSLADVAGLICGETGDCSVPSREGRLFNRYSWKAEYWKADTLPDLSRFNIDGPVWDSASWSPIDLNVAATE